MLFLGLGFLLGDRGLQVVSIGLDSSVLEVVAVVALALVLFLDAVNLMIGGLATVMAGWGLRFRPSPDAVAWRRGAAGERRTARLLSPLERHGWTVLHDWPSLVAGRISTTW
jgi:hypothetical protein